MSWLLFVTVCLTAVVWITWRYKNRRLLRMAKNIPGPPALPIIGDALKFMCQPEELIKVIKQLMDEYGDVFRFWLGPDLNVVVSNPDDAKLLLSNMKTSVKGPQYKYMADVIGGGILSGSGPSWRKHRKIATPNYGKRAIESYGDVFNQELEFLLAKYRPQAGQYFNIYKYIVQTTSYSVCQTLMGLTKDQTMNLPYIQCIIDDSPKIYDIVFDRMTKWYLQLDPVFCITKSYQEQQNFIKMTTEFSRAVIQHRINHLKTLEKQNIFDLLNPEEDGLNNTELSVVDRFILSKEFGSEELVKETFTIFTSSQEASAKITSFVLLMMAYHPDCQEKLYAEIRRVMGTENRPVNEEDLKQMTYLDMVFKEVLRLFPIGALLQRTIAEDMPISSGVLPAGCSLVIPIYHMHRNPRFWERPDVFDPERFRSDNIRKRHPYCYIPFSLGPMDCLGRYFGTKLIKTICVGVLREFEVTTKGSYADLKLAIAISVVALDGYYLKLTPRRPYNS